MMKTILPWTLRLASAVIMLQTLYYKFTAHPDSVYIFTTIGMEPWGRIGVGVNELIASIILLFVGRFVWLGALMGVGLMAGAIFFHAVFLGVVVNNDGGKLFALALIVLICCSWLLVLKKDEAVGFVKNLIK